MADPKTHGGRREGAGRKPAAAPDRRRPVTVWLSPEEEAYLDRTGNGNKSAGVRELIRRDDG
jgi:hypothetical protein